MKRLITFTVVFTLVCCTSCKPPDNDEEEGKKPEVVIPPKKYVVGNYYNVNGVQGIVYDVDADSLHGKIISMDETDSPWGNNLNETGATDAYDGMKNMTNVKEKDIANYPAFKWCNDKGSGWYLPSQNELWDIVELHGDLQDSLEFHQGIKFSSPGQYWSSTELRVVGSLQEFQNASAVSFPIPVASYVEKTTPRKVRAIRAF